jgi:hypothetical protein
MEIHLGWGSQSKKLVVRDRRAHVEWLWRERGGHDASPTGISYHWWSDPQSIPFLIAELQELHAEYELWLMRELAQYQADGLPMSDEQIARIEKARADGLI